MVSNAVIQRLRQENYQLAVEEFLGQRDAAPTVPQDAALKYFIRRAYNSLRSREMLAAEANEAARLRQEPFAQTLAKDIARRHQRTAHRYDTGSKYNVAAGTDTNPRRHDRQHAAREPLLALMRSRKLLVMADVLLAHPGSVSVGSQLTNHLDNADDGNDDDTASGRGVHSIIYSSSRCGGGGSLSGGVDRGSGARDMVPPGLQVPSLDATRYALTRFNPGSRSRPESGSKYGSCGRTVVRDGPEAACHRTGGDDTSGGSTDGAAACDGPHGEANVGDGRAVSDLRVRRPAPQPRRNAGGFAGRRATNSSGSDHPAVEVTLGTRPVGDAAVRLRAAAAARLAGDEEKAATRPSGRRDQAIEPAAAVVGGGGWDGGGTFGGLNNDGEEATAAPSPPPPPSSRHHVMDGLVLQRGCGGGGGGHLRPEDSMPMAMQQRLLADSLRDLLAATRGLCARAEGVLGEPRSAAVPPLAEDDGAGGGGGDGGGGGGGGWRGPRERPCKGDGVPG